MRLDNKKNFKIQCNTLEARNIFGPLMFFILHTLLILGTYFLRMKKLILFSVIIGFVSISKAQYFHTGQDPASLRWRQTNTENFQIIYPHYYENQAQKLASIMEIVYKKGGQTLNFNPSKISIILHTQTVKSNGLVAWAPKRMEMYTIPHQDIYSQNWIEQLAIHEFRHVVQIDKIQSELPKIIKALLGEQGTALVFGALVPWWFIEGDAVISETALSNSGRGRFPSFLMEHKALAVEKGNYKYDKAYNGSYKNHVPDHYKLGYFLVGKSREKYGADIWKSVLERVGSKPFSLKPFSKSLKLQTGLNMDGIYTSVFGDLKNEWLIEDKKYTAPGFEIVSHQNKTYANYNYNHWLNDSIIISYKTALNSVPSFVRIDSYGNEKRIAVPGTIFDQSVGYHGEWIVWSEQVPNPRWQHGGKSLIRLLNTENKNRLTIKTEFTALSPAISPDKKSVVVVESDFLSNYYLSVYQIFTGKLLHRFQTKNNNYFFSPEWLNEKEAVAVVLFPEGKRLARVNFENNIFEIISEKEFGEIKNLKLEGNFLYFIGTYSAKNNLYRINLIDNSVSQVYESRFGIESPAFSPSGKNLVLSDYTSDGFRLIKTEIDKLNLADLNITEKRNYELADKLAKQEPGVIDFFVNDSAKFKSRKYSKITHLFNFHSWAPAAIDATTYEIEPGVSVLSQNKLGTAVLDVGYKWNITEKTGKFYGKYTYKGWYPVFDFEISSGKSASEYAEIKKDTVFKRFTWVNSNFSIDARIPLDLSRGRFNRFVQPQIKYEYTAYKHDSSTPAKFFAGNFQSLSYRIYYQQLIKRSMQDVYPDFGIVLDALCRNSPFGDTNLGSLVLGQSILYLPGMLSNHGIRLYAGVQDKTRESRFSFVDVIRYPRGWGKINTNQMVSVGSDYKFPVFYPEWSLGGLVYIQRINASVFADYANLTANIFKNGEIVGSFNTDITSLGLELTGNANFLRFYAPVEIGIRSSYLPKLKNVYFDFLFSIDFNSL